MVPSAEQILSAIPQGATMPWDAFQSALSAAIGPIEQRISGLVDFANPTQVSRPTANELVVSVTEGVDSPQQPQGGQITTTASEVTVTVGGALQVAVTGLRAHQGALGGTLTRFDLANAPNNLIRVTVTVHVPIVGDQHRSFTVDQFGNPA